MESVRRLTPPQLLVGVAALIVVGLAFAYLSVLNDEDADVVGFVIVTLVAIALSAFLVLWLVPREEAQPGAHRPARTALILGIVAFVTLFGFWTGLPFVFGVPALYLGAVGQARVRERPTTRREERDESDEADEPDAAETPSERLGGGEALAGTVLGAAAVVLGLLLCLIG
jgi:hypothetical protein